MDNGDAARIDKLVLAASNQVLDASAAIDPDDRAVITAIRSGRIHGVRVADDYLPGVIDGDSDRSDQIVALGEERLISILPVHIDHDAKAEIAIRGSNIGDVNMVTEDGDALGALEVTT